MVLQCSLNAWLKKLASEDQRRLEGSGSTLEACSRRFAIQIHSLLHLLTYLKRQNKLAVKEDYQNRNDSIPGRPLLPAADIPTGLQEIHATIWNDMQMARQLQQL